MPIKTADLCDRYGGEVQVAEGVFRDYGGVRAFGGQVITVKVDDDNVLVRGLLEQPGQGRVLVVDGGGSLRCALVGGLLVELAVRNGWAGLLVYGAVRDADELAQTAVGVKALGTNPRHSKKEGTGQTGVSVTCAGVTFNPGDYVYADEDGVIVAGKALVLE